MTLMKKIDLNIEATVFTSGTAAEIVIAIFELLLYQRNQIPFVYKTYKYYVTSWTENDNSETEHDTDLTTYQVKRQRELAKATRDAISIMRQLILRAFEMNTIKSMRFLFGATACTPKEAYTIHIPVDAISQNHCHEHHRIATDKLNQSLLSLLTNEHLYSIFSNNLTTTNLYLEFETVRMNCDSKRNELTEQITPKDYCPLPNSCKDIHIHIQHVVPLNFDYKSLQCCLEMQIFEDMLGLKLMDDNKGKIMRSELTNLTDVLDTAWWEADIIVRGFKEKSIKGGTLWTK